MKSRAKPAKVSDERLKGLLADRKIEGRQPLEEAQLYIGILEYCN